MSEKLKLTEGWLDRNIAAAKSFDIVRLHATIDAQAAEIAALREALKPFAETAIHRGATDADRWHVLASISVYVRVGDLRRAAAAYGGKE